MMSNEYKRSEKGNRPRKDDAGFVSENRRPNLSTAEAWAASVAEPEEPSLVIQLPPLLVDEKTAAELLGVSRRLIFDLNKQGFLTSKMVGSRKMYSVKKLRAFAEGEVS